MMKETERPAGLVVKGLGGLYEVELDGGVGRVFSHARGNLRRDEEKVLIGDRVRLSEVPDGELIIDEILPRRNFLIRPPLANLDLLYAVIAAVRPVPSLETLDKLLAIAEYNGIRAAVIVTKQDCDNTACASYCDIYRRVGLPVFPLSSETGEGIELLRRDVEEQLTENRTAAFAGASGVGKSTLMNRLFPSLLLETGEISRKIDRGRHTTRHVELYRTGNGGYLADTPGFSLLDFAHFDFFRLADLVGAFRDFTPYLGQCRYADCTHTGERPAECAIARAVTEGEIAPSRHGSYRALFRTLKEKERF